MTLIAPTLILVNPQLGENIGMSMRAMLNCGLADLRLVAPRDGWPNDKGVAASSGAADMMPPPKIYDTTAQATADLQFVYATSGKLRHMVKPTYTAASATIDMRNRLATGARVGVLFGPERTGLLNDDLASANAIITIPTNPEFSSLNVAQTVMIMAYEWLRSGDDTPPRKYDTVQSPPATMAETAYMLTRLEDELAISGFFTAPHLREPVMRNIGNMFRRADMSSQDVQTFQGIITALLGRKKQKQELK